MGAVQVSLDDIRPLFSAHVNHGFLHHPWMLLTIHLLADGEGDEFETVPNERAGKRPRRKLTTSQTYLGAISDREFELLLKVWEHLLESLRFEVRCSRLLAAGLVLESGKFPPFFALALEAINGRCYQSRL